MKKRIWQWLQNASEWLEGFRLNFFVGSMRETTDYLKKANRKEKESAGE